MRRQSGFVTVIFGVGHGKTVPIGPLDRLIDKFVEAKSIDYRWR